MPLLGREMLAVVEEAVVTEIAWENCEDIDVYSQRQLQESYRYSQQEEEQGELVRVQQMQ